MGNLNHLPTDILLDIITRLPTELILGCKSVCKPWRDLICHHPSFYQMYLSHLNLNHPAPDSGKLTFLVAADNQQYHYFEYNEKHDETTPIHSITRINFTPPFTSFYKVIGSVNGLVSLYTYQDISACICNPVTKEFVLVPKFNRDCADKYIHCSRGFGYSSLGDEYKVVELHLLGRGPKFIVEAAVYTLGSGNGWMNVARFDVQSAEVYVEDGIFVNGALHWRNPAGGRVAVFNLTDEMFIEHLPPPPLSHNSMYYAIGELGGVLYYAIYGCSCFDIWLLKEKNDNLDIKEHVEVESSGWRKEFSLLKKRPLSFTKSGGVLCFNHNSLSIYDAKASTSLKLVDFRSLNAIIAHKNTLVSLKELGEEGIKILNSAEIETVSGDFTAKLLAR